MRTRFSRWTALPLAALLWLGHASAAPGVTVGSKKFTESVILGEIAVLTLREAGIDAQHRAELGGTAVLWNALRSGEIDIYPEYTGTLFREIFANAAIRDSGELETLLARHGVRMTGYLGFNNSYVLGMRRDVAARFGIEDLSGLAAYPHLRLGFSNEFMDREDGWPGLRRHYVLPQQDVRGLDHDLAYRGIAEGWLDVVDLYATDAEIRYYTLRPLIDDRGYFPEYQAVFLYRADLDTQAPGVAVALRTLEGRIPAQRMIEMNAAVKIGKRPESAVAAEFTRPRARAVPTRPAQQRLQRLLRNTRDHLVLVGISLVAAIAVAIPLGIIAARRPAAGRAIIGLAGVIQTIPSLALLVFMIPLFGIGGPPAVIALFLYSLLPIISNTHAGLCGIPAHVRESAVVLGLPPGARLRLVELPLASGYILAGIKTSAVINVGTATLGALIGAGGYGQPILTGIRLDDTALILEGAIPAALLALLVQGLFDLAESRLLPPALRYRRIE